MTQPTYKVMHPFMYRLPMRSLQYLDRVTNIDEQKMTKKDAIKMLVDDDMKEAIRVASPTLFEALAQLDHKTGKELNHIFDSILKYYIRMCSRPTPFGLFSSVGVGNLRMEKQNLAMALPTEAGKCHYRFSYEWLYALVKELERDIETFKQLRVCANQLITETKEKYHLSFYPDRSSQKNANIEEASIRKTALVSFILSETTSERCVSDIITAIQAHQDVSEEKIVAFLQRLVEKDFLLSDLRVSLSVPRPIEKLHARITEVNQNIHHHFAQLYKKVQLVNERGVFEETQYQYLTEMMKAIVPAREYLHMDRYFEQKDMSLPMGEMEATLSNLVDWYVKLAPVLTQQAPHMDVYYQQFVDRYGFNHAINVKTLLEDQTQLGPPPTYTVPRGQLDAVFAERSQVHTKESTFLRELLYEALLHGKEEIDLMNVDVPAFPSVSQSIRGSFDIYAALYAENEEALQKGNYRLYPSGNELSPGAGKTFGRFLDLFPEEQHEIREMVCDEEFALYPDKLLVNVNIHPAKLKARNVMHAENDFPYELSLSSMSNPEKQEITLDDLYVYASNGRFHLFSKSHQREIVPLTAHMVNHQYHMPNMYRFLFEAAAYRTFSLTSFHWGESASMPYVPRVVAGKAVLSPATWHMSFAPEKEDIDTFITQFFAHYRVPRYFKCVDHDHFLLIDTHSKTMMALFKRELRKKKKLRLCEAPEMTYESIVYDQNGAGYANEFIFSVFINDMKETPHSDVHAYYAENERQKALGSEWLSVKLYYTRDAKETVLLRLEESLVSLADEWFYILYTDPLPHIRLRMKVNDQKRLVEIVQSLHDFFERLRGGGQLQTIIYEPYMQEIERYGGPALIQMAESIFCADSALIMPLYEHWAKQTSFKKEDVALFTASHMLSSFLTADRLYKWLQQHVEVTKDTYKSYRTLHKNRRDAYDEAVLYVERHCSQQLSDLTRKVRAYAEYMSKERSVPQKYQNDIILSFLHMHLNRYGIHGQDEHQLLQFLLFKEKEAFFKQRALEMTTR
ncbi:lantibiotic dehydratase [Shouchella lonarensis]|uniref:Thiopeptide-type bacteriocin biosynthesis domain-containing protein n=1 Tax=Shouchella lonarensis TaxID=1464122 RepID=A0A1G6GUP6_9BACI|nr:lantibiotic dehydratase [Shouchella lonarensis]SDB85661.1 thiopeptide-type bacteriocin biosynthesis domain-containing protein [Shouchella lonarensis]